MKGLSCIHRWGVSVAWATMALVSATQGAPVYVPSDETPPKPLREFRGVCIATVKNIDWPSRARLTAPRQKEELVRLLDRAKQLHFNAVFLQVRPACDAFYRSNLEPWSEFLSGRMGTGPVPYYDPLQFAVREAHRRGLELHAWFNPYRARHASSISSVAPNHISKTKPNLVRRYGKNLWLDPGEREVQEHSLRVVLDVVRRYDIDGVHFDDYFYPYPEKQRSGQVIPFPDWPSWQTYRRSGGKLDRNSWRRENVNLFVMRVSQSIKEVKPTVKFGIAPFGIWRPGHPSQIRGLDAYGVIYADARKWLREGWVDYLSPQLYWSDHPPPTSFSALLRWWVGQNVKHRHIWPGLDLTRIGTRRSPQEIVNQIRFTRKYTRAQGAVHWGVGALMENRRGIRDALAAQVYGQPALLPPSPWLDSTPPPRPTVVVDSGSSSSPSLRCRPGPGENTWLWLLQLGRQGVWQTDIRGGNPAGIRFVLPDQPDVIAVRAVDRSGNISPPVVLRRQ